MKAPDPPPSHLLDSPLWGGPYRHTLASEVFSDAGRLERWLQVEAALARAQAALGVVPNDAAARITAHTHAACLDLDALRVRLEVTGHSLVPVIEALQVAVGEEAAPYVHLGATTQDIQDTAQSMALRAIHHGVLEELSQLIPLLCALASAERDHVMTGRTHWQPALPVTLGLKVAGWLDELLRARDRLTALAERVYVVQLFGGAGTSAAFAPHGLELAAGLARELELAAPRGPWHNARDRVLEWACAMVHVTAALARVGSEVLALSRPEIGELRLQAPEGAIGSSTMPHKVNPDACTHLVVLHQTVTAAVGALMGAPAPEHERDYRGVRLEWLSLPSVAHGTLKALETARALLGRLSADSEAIARNLDRFGAELMTERVMLALGERIGRHRAYPLMISLCRRTLAAGLPLDAGLRAAPELLEHLDPPTLHALLQPSHHAGHAGELVDRIVAAARDG